VATSASQKFQRSKVTGIYYRERVGGKRTFYIRYTGHDGKRAWSACESFELAKKRLADVTTKRVTGEVIDTTTTLRELVPKWQAQRDGYIKPWSAATRTVR
jgi:hypothetical protein